MESKRIMLADDEADITTILKRYLELDGYIVTVCSDGQQVLDTISGSEFDLIILDVMMPKVNGWEACKKIKEDEKTKGIPVIMLTAKSQDVDAIMSIESGADEYATKPFDYAELSITIKKLLTRGKER